MPKIIRILGALVFGSMLHWASAASPVWGLNQVYSNADRSVQFVVHSTPESGQQYLSGLTLAASGEGIEHTFTFPHDLPGNSAGRSFLIATQGFADLNVLQPDYVVPNGFFPVSAGVIWVAGHGYEHRAVPTDGVTAYWLEPDFYDWYATAVATNFAGASYRFNTAPPPRLPPFLIGPGVTGAWYDPAQSGHGLFVEVLSDSRFHATWFAFNPAGTTQSWFTGVGTYSGNTATIGSVEQPSGGRWIPNFDPGRIVRNSWGTLTFTFTDCNHGRVDFNSVSGYGAGGMDLRRLTQPMGLSCQ